MASFYDKWMRDLNEKDDDLARPQEQAALLSYLNGTTTTDVAAYAFTKQGTESETRSADLTWSLLIDVAKELPKAHRQLVELVDAIEQVPTTETKATREYAGNVQYFAFELRDAFNGMESASQSSHSTITDEHHYINLCAFIARYWHNQHGEWTDWAMQLAHNGLEDDHRKPLTNLSGQAVAQLFLFSAPEMYASSSSTESSTHDVGPLLLKERETATVSRWNFWKRRLGQLKKSDILSNETGELFSKALESMAKVEAESG